MVNYVPQIDYTSRDYAAIRQDMIDLIPSFAPQWLSRDPADFGITLIELFAYMGDLLNYYIDRSANEAFISTASQRDSVLQLSRLLGYNPTQATAATVTLTFQNSSASDITVPALTQVSTTTISNGSTVQVTFETSADVTVPAKSGSVNGSATVTATEGITESNELVGNSDGTPTQSFQLSQTSVINDSVSTLVGTVPYQRVEYLIDYNNYDPVFTIYTDAEGISYITFGDDVSGRIPPISSQIYVTYRVGGGIIGNVASNTLKNIIKFPSGSIPAGLSVNNQDISITGDGAATGGADAETTDSIRINAPKSIRSLNRAVSLTDYASLAVQVSGVSKAIAASNVFNSVVLYMVPYGDPGVQVDGVTPSTVFNTYSNEVTTFLAEKIPTTTTVTIQPPSYVPVNLIVNVTVLPTYKQSLVTTAVNAIIAELLLIDNVTFNDRISLQDLMTAIGSVNGVAYCQFEKLIRNDKDLNYSINNKAADGTVATLTTSVNHALTVGQTVVVSGVDTTFNGAFVITGVTSNTFSYTLISSVISSTSAVGAVTVATVNDIVCAFNEIPKAGTIIVNASGGVLN